MSFQKEIQGCEEVQQIRKKKKRDKHSLRDRQILFTPMDRRPPLGRASLQISLKKWRKAGLTVEAAFVLPLFFLVMVTLAGFMDIYRLQTEKLTGLCQMAKSAAAYSYGAGERDEDIVLPSVYTYQAPFSPVSLPVLVMHNEVKIRPWTGSAPCQPEEEGGAEPSTEMVYMTENGKVYHGKNCTHLNLSVQAVSGWQIEALRNESGGKYVPCEHCSAEGSPGSTVYITRTGDRYHNHASCSGLKRTVRLVKREEVQEKYGACSRCGGHS